MAALLLARGQVLNAAPSIGCRAGAYPGVVCRRTRGGREQTSAQDSGARGAEPNPVATGGCDDDLGSGPPDSGGRHTPFNLGGEWAHLDLDPV